MLAASALGVKFDHRLGREAFPEIAAPAGPSIAELAAMIPAPVAGGDTSSASIAALKILQKGGGDAGER